MDSPNPPNERPHRDMHAPTNVNVPTRALRRLTYVAFTCLSLLVLFSACDTQQLDAPAPETPSETPSDVTTNAADAADILEYSSTVPGTINAGATATVSIVVKNNGWNTWPAGSAYRLGAGAAGSGNGLEWVNGTFNCGGYVVNPYSNARAYLCHDVAPGGTHTFQFQVRMPSGATGSRNLVVQMVRDGVAWFGSSGSFSISVGSSGGGGTYDISKYIMGNLEDGVDNKYTLSSNEHLRAHWDFNAGKAYQMKNALWEQIWWDDNYVYRGADTSPGTKNGQEYLYYLTDQYGNYGAPWTPRYWSVGDTFHFSGTIHEVYKSNCYEFNTGGQPGRMHFKAHHNSYYFSKTGYTLNDVIELEWWVGSDLIETYYYANSYGLVGWGKNATGNYYSGTSNQNFSFQQICSNHVNYY